MLIIRITLTILNICISNLGGAQCHVFGRAIEFFSSSKTGRRLFGVCGKITWQPLGLSKKLSWAMGGQSCWAAHGPYFKMSPRWTENFKSFRKHQFWGISVITSPFIEEFCCFSTWTFPKLVLSQCDSFYGQIIHILPIKPIEDMPLRIRSFRASDRIAIEKRSKSDRTFQRIFRRSRERLKMN